MTIVGNVTYQLSTQYATGISGATVRYGPSAQKYDILAALVAGGGNAHGVGGQFTINDSDLITALDKHPAVQRTGSPGPAPAPPQPQAGPLVGSYGPLLQRPSLQSVPDRFKYFATDDNGGAEYQVQNGAWVRTAGRGLELGSAQITTSSTPTSQTTPTAIVTGLSVPVTVTNRPVRVVLNGSLGQNGTSSYNAHVGIFEDGVQIGGQDSFMPATQFADVPMAPAARSAPAPGDHTYDFRIWTPLGGAQSVFVAASPTNKTILEVVEI